MSNIDNRQLVEKATISAVSALASSGKLNPAQADKFIDFVFDESVLTKLARVVRFRNEQLEIDKIGLGRRSAMPKAEAISPSSGMFRGVETSKVVLQPKEIIVPFEISDIFMEINLEGMSVENHIIQMFSRQLANDLEELYIMGDQTGPLGLSSDLINSSNANKFVLDNYLGLMDGFVHQADAGQVLDFGSTDGAGNVTPNGVSAGLFSRMLNLMPTKFKRDKNKLAFVCPVEIEQLYRERIASRATVMGDSALNTIENMTPFGIPLVGVPLMPLYPTYTEQVGALAVGATHQMNFKAIKPDSVVIVPTANVSASVEANALVEGVAYSVDYSKGIITDLAGGLGANFTVTYQVFPQIMLTLRDNLILGLGRDIRLEKDRDIFRGVNQFALSVKASVTFEEISAVVKAVNVSDLI
jgi:hypothetical protein